MKEWDNDRHEEALERRRNKKFDLCKFAAQQGKTGNDGKVIITVSELKKLKEENLILNRLLSIIDDLTPQQIIDVDKAIQATKQKAASEAVNKFTEYIKAKLSAIYKERVSEKSDGDFKLGASLLLVAQGEIEKAKGEFLNGENNSG